MVVFVLIAALLLASSEAMAQGAPGVSGVNVAITTTFVSRDEGGVVIAVTADRAIAFGFGVLVPRPNNAGVIPTRALFNIKSPEGAVMLVRRAWSQVAIDISAAGENKVWDGLSVGGSVIGPGVTVTTVRIPFRDLDSLFNAGVHTVTIVAEIGLDANSSLYHRREIRISDIPRKPAAPVPNQPQDAPPSPSSEGEKRT